MLLLLLLLCAVVVVGDNIAVAVVAVMDATFVEAVLTVVAPSELVDGDTTIVVVSGVGGMEGVEGIEELARTNETQQLNTTSKWMERGMTMDAKFEHR